MLFEYYECDCSYKITRDNIDTEKVKLTDRMVDEIQEVECCACGGPYAKEVQVKKYICPNCEKDLVLKTESDGSDEVCEDVSGGTLQIMGAEYKNPIHSDSLALSPDQVAQHKKDFPDIEIDDQCRPVFTHKKTHEEYMDKCGIVKQRQKTKKSKGKIYSYPGSKCS